MNEELRKVIAGYNKLSFSDRKKFVELIENQLFEGATLNESLQKSEQITLGPLQNGCPCCGRG